jgi:hypothetical protein
VYDDPMMQPLSDPIVALPDSAAIRPEFYVERLARLLDDVNCRTVVIESR